MNSDGDLPLDLAESDAMEGLLKAEIARRGGPRGLLRGGPSVPEDPDSLGLSPYMGSGV